MIKVIAITKRKPGLTLENFSRYWYEKHAPLGFKHLPRTLPLKRYVHNYTMPMMAGQEYPFDGAAEFCFDDLDAYRQWQQWFTGDGGRPLREDGKNFMDYSTVKTVIVEENIIIPDPSLSTARLYNERPDNPITDMIKIIAMVKRKPGLTLDDFSQYWREQHAPLALSLIPDELGVKGYVHNYAVNVDETGEQAFDGIGVLYFENMDIFLKSNEWFFGEPGRALRDDEENFVDTGTRIAAVVQERVIRPWSVIAGN